MMQTTDAIYSDGVFKPVTKPALCDQQRVRLIIQPIDDSPGDRAAAISRLRRNLEQGEFFCTEPLPSRDELHDRV